MFAQKTHNKMPSGNSCDYANHAARQFMPEGQIIESAGNDLASP
jgi:hypothetical protein